MFSPHFQQTAIQGLPRAVLAAIRAHDAGERLPEVPDIKWRQEAQRAHGEADDGWHRSVRGEERRGEEDSPVTPQRDAEVDLSLAVTQWLHCRAGLCTDLRLVDLRCGDGAFVEISQEVTQEEGVKANGRDQWGELEENGGGGMG